MTCQGLLSASALALFVHRTIVNALGLRKVELVLANRVGVLRAKVIALGHAVRDS